MMLTAAAVLVVAEYIFWIIVFRLHAGLFGHTHTCGGGGGGHSDVNPIV